jgi:hypothetical protein
MVSETDYVLTTITSIDHVLYNTYRHLIPKIFSSTDISGSQAFVDASYYVHPAITQLYISDLFHL